MAPGTWSRALLFSLMEIALPLSRADRGQAMNAQPSALLAARMNKTLVQEQFGKNAAGYLTSTPHALGKSLERLVVLTSPQKSWRVLDVATGGGHVAYTFAPHVERVWATDITQEMLDLVKGEAKNAGLPMCARPMPRPRRCRSKTKASIWSPAASRRITSNSIADFLDQVRRVLKPGGHFALVDNVVPPGSVGDYVNAFERFRDPSHLRAWTMEEWRSALKAHGFSIGHEEQLGKQMEFKSWAGRHDAVMQALLRAMLAQATPEVKATLEPKGEGAELTFRLSEGLFIAQRE